MYRNREADRIVLVRVELIDTRPMATIIGTKVCLAVDLLVAYNINVFPVATQPIDSI
jgi:hypothetical protein